MSAGLAECRVTFTVSSVEPIKFVLTCDQVKGSIPIEVLGRGVGSALEQKADAPHSVGAHHVVERGR